jgi:menaquinol-cytochrome c reductase iron-sulfur subunit
VAVHDERGSAGRTGGERPRDIPPETRLEPGATTDGHPNQSAAVTAQAGIGTHDPPAAGAVPVEPRVTVERRGFLMTMTAALSGLAGVLVGVPFIGFLVAPVRRAPDDRWRPVGPAADFEIGATVKVIYVDPEPLPWAGFSADSAAYVRRIDATTVVAFSIYCTHTGCPVQWVEPTGLFFCPCHGGAFTRDGSVAAGPPPRPLERHEARIRNGQVEVRTRRVPLPPPGA